MVVVIAGVMALAADSGAGLADAPPAAPHINAGDLLVQFGQFCTEGCAGQPTDRLDVLSPDATLRGELHLAGISDVGALAFDASGYLYKPGTLEGGSANVYKYPHSGGNGAAFLQLDSGVELLPPGMVFSPGGMLYAAGRRYTPTGSTMGVFRYTSTGQPSPLGEQVAAAPLDGDLDILGIALSGCTLAYGGPGQIKRYDICGDQQLDDFPTAPASSLAALRGYSDGTFISVEVTEVKRISPDGTVQTFPDANGCATSADAYAGYLYVLDACLHSIERFNLATGQSLGVWKQYSEAEIVARGAIPVRIHVYDRTAPPKPIIFVHGVTTSFEAGSFSSLLSDPSISPSVVRFAYFQDAGTTSPCPPPVPVIDLSTGIPVDLASANQARCDSESDIGINAVALREFVRASYAASGGQRAILVGFSMGAAIIRGFVDYSVALPGDSTATDMVDSVIFIEGAHNGSYLLLAPNSISGAVSVFGSVPGLQGFVEKWLQDQLDRFGFHWDRPAATELNPLSSWYAWANNLARPLPGNIGYYNAYGNIDLKTRTCAWDWFGVSKCHEPHVLDIGDGLLLPGNDDGNPYTGSTGLNARGGARFSRPNTAEQWQWALYHKFVIHPLNAAKHPDRERQRLTDAIGAAPELHLNISSQSASTYVFDCTTGATVRLNQQLLEILKGKIGVGAYACPLH